jgi:acyl carrier protein
VVVSTADLGGRLALWLRRGTPKAEFAKSFRTQTAERNPRPRLRSVYVAPRNELEEKIAKIWADFLGVTPIGVDDDFFELGGHSLMVIQLIGELGRVLKTEVPLRALFEGPTVGQLANACLQYVEPSLVD